MFRSHTSSARDVTISNPRYEKNTVPAPLKMPAIPAEQISETSGPTMSLTTIHQFTKKEKKERKKKNHVDGGRTQEKVENVRATKKAHHKEQSHPRQDYWGTKRPSSLVAQVLPPRQQRT